MPEENSNEHQETIEITETMIQDFVKEIIKLEQDNLYVNRANLKDQIVNIVKTKVR